MNNRRQAFIASSEPEYEQIHDENRNDKGDDDDDDSRNSLPTTSGNVKASSNTKGIFDLTIDTQEELEQVLRKRGGEIKLL